MNLLNSLFSLASSTNTEPTDNDSASNANNVTNLWRKTKQTFSAKNKIAPALPPHIHVTNSHTASPPTEKVIGIGGVWYDVSSFVDSHPGGKVIEEYFGKDATVVFKVWHRSKVLTDNHMKPVGTYPLHLPEMDKKLLSVHNSLLSKNQYTTDHIWALKTVALGIFFFIASSVLLQFSINYSYSDSDSHSKTEIAIFYLRYFCCILLTLAWQQCGLLMHDAMHSSLTFNPSVDAVIGFLVGNCGFGVNAKWWKINHNIHHLFTNTIDIDHVSDPQMFEVSWIQSPKFFPFEFYRQGWWQTLLISWQKYLWLPICIFVGRFSIIFDSYRLERDVFQFCGLGIHIAITWYGYLCHFDGWLDAVVWYYVTACCVGVLTLQLLISHYDKPFEEKKVVMESSWFVRQAAASKDIVNPPWMDWFHGGLNFHFAHHALPRLPRQKSRMADGILRGVLKENGIEIDRVPFFHAIWDCVVHLGDVAEKYGVWRVVNNYG